MTEAGWWNSAEMDEGATRALVTRSNPGQPPQVYLADADGPAHRLDRGEQARRRRIPTRRSSPPMSQPSFGTIRAADGTDLHYRMLSPPREPGRRYPVFVQVYGGPATGRQATRAWGSPLQQYLVQHGWIVFSLDNRGSPDRGHAFETAIYHAMGGVEVQDQLAGVAWLRSQALCRSARASPSMAGPMAAI